VSEPVRSLFDLSFVVVISLVSLLALIHDSTVMLVF
jgi:hypothetical protein